MSDNARKCVFDCNVFYQAMISGKGPAAACVERAREGKILLFISQYVLDGLLDLCNRPKLQAQFGITPGSGAVFVQELLSFASIIGHVPEIYVHPFDRDDSHYVNLAIATDSELIVSRDRHLQNLMDAARPDGKDFRSRFPQLRILAPEQLLLEVG